MPTPVQTTHWATHLIETLLTCAGNENAIFLSYGGTCRRNLGISPTLPMLHLVIASLGPSQNNRFHDGCMLVVLQPDSRLHCTPEVCSGSKPESTIFGLMSALATCGHNAKSGFVSPVPHKDTYAVQQKFSYSITSSARARNDSGML